MKKLLTCLGFALGSALLACAPAAEPPAGGGPQATGGKAGGTGGGTGGQATSPSNSGGSGGGSGGVAAGGSGGTNSGGSTGSGGASGGSGGASTGSGGAGTGTDGGGTPADSNTGDTAGPGPSVPTIAGELDGAFLEPKCTDKPANGFCHHSGVIEQKIKFGGEAGKTYDVTLKVWGIMEGIKFTGGEPAGDHFYAGGMSVTPRYSPCALKVGDKNYYLNRKEDRANDKVYPFVFTTPAIKIPGQADLLLFCTDDASKHISINNPPPLGQAANGRHTIENPPERLKAKLGMQPYSFLFTYLEAASAVLVN
jgi:hypothetical protein